LARLILFNGIHLKAGSIFFSVVFLQLGGYSTSQGWHRSKRKCPSISWKFQGNSFVFNLIILGTMSMIYDLGAYSNLSPTENVF